jgi:hypothetical protein
MEQIHGYENKESKLEFANSVCMALFVLFFFTKIE